MYRIISNLSTTRNGSATSLKYGHKVQMCAYNVNAERMDALTHLVSVNGVITKAYELCR